MAPTADARRRPPSISVPSLKFVRLAVRKTWHTMCVSINGLGDIDLQNQCASRIKGGEPSFQIWTRYAFGFSKYSLCTRRTDGRTDGQKQRLMPPSLRARA